jgi:formate C-acetyltransferase
MSAKVLEHYWTEIGKYTSRRGGVFTGACSLLEGGISMGRNVGAMPDGRFAGEPLGNTIGPRTGADKSGVTNMLLSVSRMPLKLGVGGSGCNVLFPRQLMQTVESRAKVAGLIKAFMMMGGQLAQITTASKEEMIAAQQKPEDWGNLIVRVGGFSQKFVELGRSTQNELIMRYGE